jgi:hypothetical protein
MVPEVKVNHEANRTFLDYAGLKKLWGIIDDKFADKNNTITEIGFELSGDNNTHMLVTTLADGITKLIAEVPNASATQPGLMSSNHFTLLDELDYKIESVAPPFTGICLTNENGVANDVLLINRKANLDLQYQTIPASDGTIEKAYIALVDNNYPTTGNWMHSNKDSYDLSINKSNWLLVKQPNGTYEYYYWTIENELGPIDENGEPILSQPVSRIDITSLVKTGLLLDSDVVINPSNGLIGTFLKLVFNAVDADGNPKPQVQYINISDLVKIYTSGEGISIIDETGSGTDDTQYIGKINVVAATDDKLGAFKTGYQNGNKTYAIELDPNNKAYVAVPWNETKVIANNNDADVDADGNPYLTVDCITDSNNNDDKSTTTTYAISVTAGDSIKNADILSRTAIQSIVSEDDHIVINANNKDNKPIQLGTKGTQWSLSLSETAKESLNKADSAVQSINVIQYSPNDRPLSDPNKNDIILIKHNDASNNDYTIGLGERTKDSLNKADSAVQVINIMGTIINNTNNVYTVDNAKKVMSIGSAAEVNVSNDETLEDTTSTIEYVEANNVDKILEKTVDNVPTVAAVKAYVDNKVIKTNSNVIEYLDSKIEPGTTTNSQGIGSAHIFTKIVIKDGKFVEPGATENLDENGASESRPILISDIINFTEMTDEEINKICNQSIE